MNNSSTINFESHIPYYIQLMDLLKTQIVKKKWGPGEQIPGEQDLCETYGVSRTVVRQALRELELEGVITRRKGKGTFISEPKISEGLIQKLDRFLPGHDRTRIETCHPGAAPAGRAGWMKR